MAPPVQPRRSRREVRLPPPRLPATGARAGVARVVAVTASAPVLGHGYCAYTFFEQCPHHTACARCDFYTSKASSRAIFWVPRRTCRRCSQAIPLPDGEGAAVDYGQAALDRLLDRLADVPTPDGPMPRQLGIPATGTLLLLVEIRHSKQSARSYEERSPPAAPIEGWSMTSQPAPNLEGLSPELGQGRTLQIALQSAVHQAGDRIDVLPERAPGWKRTGARAA